MNHLKITRKLPLIVIFAFLSVYSGDLFAQCPTSNEVTITVVPEPSISISGTPTTICAGGTASLTATSGGGTGTCTIQWQSSANGVTWTDIAGANAATYTTPALSATTYYRATYSCTGAGCDAATSSSVTITVNPDLNITAQPNSITQCIGGTDALSVTITGGTGTIAYQWQSSTNGTTWTNVSGATSSTYTPPSTAAGTTYYRVNVTGSGNGCDAITSNSATVTITAPLAISTQPNDITQCVGGTDALSVSITGGAGAISYQWQVSNNGTTWTNVSGATASNYTPSSATAGTTYYRVIVNAAGTGCAAVTSNAASVTITPSVSIASHPANITECIGGTGALNVSISGGSGAVSYQWQSSANGTTWANVSGATSASYTPPSTAAGTTYYRVVIGNSASGCASVTSNSATVTVTPILAISTQPSNITECVGGTDALSVAITGGAGTISYQWQSSANGVTWANVTGAIASSYTPPSTTAGTTYYRVIVNASGSGCVAVTSTSATVTITPTIAITAQPNDITECIGGTDVLNVTVSGGAGTVSYQWQVSNNGTSWTNISGATASSYTPASTVPGTTYYRALISATGNNCAAVTSNAATVTVSAPISIVTNPNNITECVGGTNALSVSVSGGAGTVSYQWQSSANGTTWANVSGATSSSYTPPSATAGTTYYRVIISASGSSCSAATSNSATVVVNPVLSITAQPNSITQCVGGTDALSISVLGGAGTVSYQWQSSGDGVAWSNISGATSSTYTPSSTTAGTTYYRAVINASGGGCTVITSNAATVTITPNLSFLVQPNDINECVGGTDVLSVSVAGGAGLVTYQWQSSTNGTTWTDVSGATASSYTPPSTAAGTTFYRVVVNAANSGCTAVTSNSARVVIAADPTLSVSVPSATVCVGGGVTLTATSTGGIGTCTIQWQNSTNGGSTWSDIPSATGNAYTTPPLNANTNYRARITCSGSGCCN